MNPPPLPGFAAPGPLRERLSGLVLAGAKTATFDLFDRARFDPLGVPTAGLNWTMHDSKDRPLAVLITVDAQVLRMSDVTFEMVDQEGESFASVDAWRVAHEEYWTPFIEEVRAQTNDQTWLLDDDTIVVFETFAIAERLAAADEGRYPVVELTVSSSDAELAAADLYDLDTIGVEEVFDDGTTVGLRAGFASDESAAEAERSLWVHHGGWKPRFEVIVGDDWLDAWREHFTEVRVGGLTIIPDWVGSASTESVDASPTTPILLDPKRAWGTGAHQSTSLVLNAMQSPAVACEQARVLDVGCGSGILGIAALMLGASSSHGIDVDRSAITVTMENARRNGVDGRCTASWVPIADVSESYDVVFANILAPILVTLAQDVQRVTRPDGTIVLAGLIDEQVERVLRAYDSCSVIDTFHDGVWRALVLRR